MYVGVKLNLFFSAKIFLYFFLDSPSLQIFYRPRDLGSSSIKLKKKEQKSSAICHYISGARVKGF